MIKFFRALIEFIREYKKTVAGITSIHEETPKDDIYMIVKKILEEQASTRTEEIKNSVDTHLTQPRKINKLKSFRTVSTGSTITEVEKQEVLSINLQSIPNQEFTLTLNGDNYVIKLKTVGYSTVATVVRNNVTLVSNLICVSGTPLIPYKYLENGNFLFYTKDGDIPFYTEYGVTQQLLYASHNTLGGLRG